MHKLKVRLPRSLRTLALAAALLPAGPVLAGDCDMLRGETIRFIVHTNQGGGYDTIARELEPFIERATGAEVIVDNVPGGGGRVAYKTVKSAAPDGRTIALANAIALIFAPVFDDPVEVTLDDFHVMGRIDQDVYVVLVATDSPVRTVEDLWNGTLGHPVAASLASAGNALRTLGSASLLGFEVVDVPLQGGSQATSLAIIRGELDVTAMSVDSAKQVIDAGEMRPILVLADAVPEGMDWLADVPLLGGPDGWAVRRAAPAGLTPEEALKRASALAASASSVRAMIAPPGVSPDLARCLDSFVTTVAASPEAVAALAGKGRFIAPLPASSLDPIRVQARESVAWLKPLADQSRAAGG
jgi:tripartite-type tricarboxylate transporter receptor subunit TctC